MYTTAAGEAALQPVIAAHELLVKIILGGIASRVVGIVAGGQPVALVRYGYSTVAIEQWQRGSNDLSEPRRACDGPAQAP
jgi:hypothetical protein